MFDTTFNNSTFETALRAYRRLAATEHSTRIATVRHIEQIVDDHCAHTRRAGRDALLKQPAHENIVDDSESASQRELELTVSKCDLIDDRREKVALEVFGSVLTAVAIEHAVQRDLGQ